MSRKTLVTALLSTTLALSLTACNIYHMPIQQGNVINSKLVNRIHKGMTKQQLVTKIGSPVLITPFRSNKLIYVYTLRPTSGKRRYRRLEVTLVNNRVTHYHVYTHKN